MNRSRFYKTHVNNKQGMTLVEVLVAMAVLSIAIMTFLPLGQSSFKNIFMIGNRIKENYHAVGTIEKLIGNTGANGDYEAETLNIPMVFSAKTTTKKLVANQAEMQSIDGASILSTPEAPNRGFSTFICDSVTAQMMAFPTHISDDFIKKQITLYAVGFRFSTDQHFQLKYTPESETDPIPADPDALKLHVASLPAVDKAYYKFEPDPDISSIARLTLNGDNDQVNFQHSPLYIVYRDFILPIELDAPTVIMVGEAAEDGKYYYYVTSGEKINNEGEIDEKNGQVRIVRKKMENIDPKPHGDSAASVKSNGGMVTLNSAMNDVEWVGPGEGNDGKGGTNEFGYYNMCGDNGQVRRFWRKANGNYAWGGDYTNKFLYVYDDTNKVNGAADSRTVVEPMYDTEVSYTYLFKKDPTTDTTGGHNYVKGDDGYNTAVHSDAGIRVIPKPADRKDYTIFDRLFVQTAFTASAINNPDINQDTLEFYTAGDALYTKKNSKTTATRDHDLNNNFVNVYSGYFKDFTGLSSTQRDELAFVKAPVGFDLQPERNAVKKYKIKDIISYETYNELDPNIKNHITLTSVDSVRMTPNSGYGGTGYPTNSYTMYCGSIPAVMDLWATNDGVPAHSGAPPTEWRATMGIAFKDLSASNKYYKFYPEIHAITGLGALNRELHYDGHLWNYAKTKATNYAFSGIVGPENYNKNNCPALYASLEAGEKAYTNFGFNQQMLPLNVSFNQRVMQQQNETMITISYMSHPYAVSGEKIKTSPYDLSPSRRDEYTGAYEWCFDDSLTIIDSDTICYPADDGTERYFSIAVGYYVGGIAYEDQKNKVISTPSVMNNSIVLLRAGGKNKEGLGTGYQLNQESNVFNQFYTTASFYAEPQGDSGAHRNTMDQAVSAGYWQDVFHPKFYSMSGGPYDYATTSEDRFNYIMGHALNDKRLNCVGWGNTWEDKPEAMWGASDGTMMSWFLDKDNNVDRKNKVDVEFQSYQRLDASKKMHEKYGQQWRFEQEWKTGLSTVSGKFFDLPQTFDAAKKHINIDDTNWEGEKIQLEKDKVKTKNPIYHNAYLDKCSLQLATKGNRTIQDGSMIDKYGFISPLDSIEDLEYANDIWVAVGTQGVSNPTPYCGTKAMVPSTATGGSWICVRTWLDQSNGTDGGPVDGNCNYVWQAVQISTHEDYNIEQVTYSNGKWYAMGYYDKNNNNEYDYKSGEYALLFYAEDPAEACGSEKGWQLCNSGHGYTQAYCNSNTAPSGAENGTGDNKVDGFKLLDIDGINSVASRND